jgi:hypothetical protein
MGQLLMTGDGVFCEGCGRVVWFVGRLVEESVRDGCDWFDQQIRQSGRGDSSRVLARAGGIRPNQDLHAIW